MAKNVFDPGKIYRVPIYGHLFDGSTDHAPALPGSFAADTVDISSKDGYGNVTEYAVFTVREPEAMEFSPAWVGTYRIPMSKLISSPPEEIGEKRP